MELGLILNVVVIVLLLVVAVLVYTWVSGVRGAVAALERRASNLFDRQVVRTDFAALQRTVENLDSCISNLQGGVDTSAEVWTLSLKKMEASLGGVRDYLAEKGNEVQRLQEGHDYAVLKSFCKQVIRCIHELAEARECVDGDAGTVLEGVRLDLVDLLDRNGVEEFVPVEGDEYSELRAFAEVSPYKEFTQDDAKVGRVIDVVRSGFKYVYNDDQVRLVLPAQVRVYAKEGEV